MRVEGQNIDTKAATALASLTLTRLALEAKRTPKPKTLETFKNLRYPKGGLSLRGLGPRSLPG